MSEAKHTLGEYRVDEDFEPGENITIEAWAGHSAVLIAVVYGTDEFPCLDEDETDFDAIQAENLATARLFAAAPEGFALAEAVRGLISRSGELNTRTSEHSLKDLRLFADAFVAKATGT